MQHPFREGDNSFGELLIESFPILLCADLALFRRAMTCKPMAIVTPQPCIKVSIVPTHCRSTARKPLGALNRQQARPLFG